jgi:hypothetical protein
MTNSRRQMSASAMLCFVLALTLQGCATRQSSTQTAQPPAEQTQEQRIAFLVYAVECGWPSDTRQARDYGADPNGKTRDGRPALNEAARSGELAIVELLIVHGANVNTKDKHGATPLAYATTSPFYKKMRSYFEDDQAKVVELLRQHGAR